MAIASNKYHNKDFRIFIKIISTRPVSRLRQQYYLLYDSTNVPYEVIRNGIMHFEMLPPRLFACWEMFYFFLLSLLTFSNLNFSTKKKFRKNYQRVKWFGSSSGPTFCLSWSGSKLFAKVQQTTKVATSIERELSVLLPLNKWAIINV